VGRRTLIGHDVEVRARRSDASSAALPGETSIWVALDGSDMQTEGA
jgi:hypothetical protein